jgi:7-carboxy-7-deazaguanine synthase (Cx14CxxC type)
MTYTVKEIFYTLQGEGLHAGRPAVFCRFAGCNLWSGREQDRSKAACRFCDTEFRGGTKYRTPEDLADAIEQAWAPQVVARRMVVLTGGEPALQVDQALVHLLQARGFYVAIETNGTKELPQGLDWVCVSPKGDEPLRVVHGNELKLVYPQMLALPQRFEELAFDHFLLQPMDGPFLEANTQAAIEFCMGNPKWRLSVQTHKYIGVR